MSDSITDLRDTIIPKSDQLNADDLIGGPLTVRITAVRRGDRDQPVAVCIDGQQPYKPCKSMRRVLLTAWGNDGAAWVGRSMTLYRDENVIFGGVKVGGIRISHLSHIDADLTIALTVTRGQREPYRVSRLQVRERPAADLTTVLADADLTLADLDRWRAADGKPATDTLTDDQRGQIAAMLGPKHLAAIRALIPQE